MKLLLLNRTEEKIKFNIMIELVYDITDKIFNHDMISKFFKKYSSYIKNENRPDVLYHYFPYHILNKLYNIDNDLTYNNLVKMCKEVNSFLMNENRDIEELNGAYLLSCL